MNRCLLHAARWRANAALLIAAVAVPTLGQEPDATSPPGLSKTPANQDHWAFRPLSRAKAPEVKHAAWVRNPVDRFVLARLEAAGLKPLPPADRATLIRRVTFDLTGLPPRPEEVEVFASDQSPEAYDKLIDRLLASPAYGERLAQHWLDLARFAETDGFEHDLVRPNAWRYRDWVIAALNADMPYDEFVRMQIAGDAQGRVGSVHLSERQVGIAHPTDRAVATGFLLCGPDMPDINLQDERRHNVLNEMTATVGSVFLGLQLGCAQCHDHKFDPITIADFYSLRAFFETAAFFDEAPLASPEELAEHERLEAPIRAERERIDKRLEKFDAVAHERLNQDPQVKIGREELLAVLSETEREQFQQTLAELKRITESKLPPLPTGRVMRDKGGPSRPSHIMLRGDFRQPGPRVTPAFPVIANPWNAPVEIPESAAPSTGRRTALAIWLTRSDHPLTTRVIVNRIWQFHFGQGLVRTASDFGKMGEPPSHPELLDWLATELPRLGWSWKRMHKLMLTSATYLQASRPSGSGWSTDQRTTAVASWRRSRELDPENRLLGRMNRRRLDGEAIRDTMLAASQRLSQRRAGPGVRPPLPEELVATLLKGQWTVSPDKEDHRTRSIYVFVRRNLRYPIFDVFDRPDTNASCPQRNRSTTAPQALELLNSQLALSAARDLAGTLLAQAGADHTAQIDLCYRLALGRRPTSDELAAAATFLHDQTCLLSRQGRESSDLVLPRQPLPDGVQPQAFAALADLCLALFNLNEFIYVD